jgi:hypothetical protein
VVDVDVDAKVGLCFGSLRHVDTARTRRRAAVVAEEGVVAADPMGPVAVVERRYSYSMVSLDLIDGTLTSKVFEIRVG